MLIIQGCEDDKNDKKKKIAVFSSQNTFYAKDDDEYYNNLNAVKPKLMTLDDCINFYNMWFSIYRDVKKNWDDVND